MHTLRPKHGTVLNSQQITELHVLVQGFQLYVMLHVLRYMFYTPNHHTCLEDALFSWIVELHSPSNRVPCKMIRQQARSLFSAKDFHASTG